MDVVGAAAACGVCTELRAALAAAEARAVAAEARAVAAEARAIAAEARAAQATRDTSNWRARAERLQERLHAAGAVPAQASPHTLVGSCGSKLEEDGGQHVRHFRGSTILARVAAGSVAGAAVDGLQSLLGWLPGPHYTPKGQAWTLIYRGSRDGWQASDFHAACDGAGSTVVLVLGTAKDDGHEFVAGGYAAASWLSCSQWQWVADPESAREVGCSSFLFCLGDAAGHGPVRLRLKDPADNKVLRCRDTCGPVFGGSRDLLVGSDSSKPLNGTDCSRTCTSLSDASYDCTEAVRHRCTTFRGRHNPKSGDDYWFTTNELEVFTLESTAVDDSGLT